MPKAFEYTTPADKAAALSEILELARENGLQETGRLKQAYDDIDRLFSGGYPGYRASNTLYHNFDHTLAVVLAAVRLISGCRAMQEPLCPADVELCLMAALMHDVGLIQTEDDTTGTGAKYTIGHEERSIDFMKRYYAANALGERRAGECGQLIRFTILSVEPSSVEIDRPELRRLGNIVGTADLLGQLSDRAYLEKLLLLYQEFEEARLPGFDCELDLITKTLDFYNHVAEVRLEKQLGGLNRAMRAHCKARLGADRDLYAEAIEKNIRYLELLVEDCGGNYDCYLNNLRRAGIVDQLRRSKSSRAMH